MVLVFAVAQNNASPTYQIQSSSMLIELRDGEPIKLTNVDGTKTTLDFDMDTSNNGVTIRTDDSAVVVNVGETKDIAAKEDIQVKVIAVEEDPYTQKPITIIEVKPIIPSEDPPTIEPSVQVEATSDLDKYGWMTGVVGLGQTVYYGVVLNEKTHYPVIKLTNHDSNSKILTFTIDGASYQIDDSQFEDKENWKEIELDGARLYMRAHWEGEQGYRDASFQIALKPGFQIPSQASCFFSPEYTLKVGESTAYRPAGPARSALEVTYRGTETPKGLMNVEFGNGGAIRFGGAFSSSRATSFIPLDRGDDWLSFTLCTIKYTTSESVLSSPSDSDLAIIDLSFDLSGPLKLVVQNTGKSVIREQQLPITLIMNEYNEQRTITIPTMQPGDIQTIVISDALVGIQFPNVKGTIASTSSPDFIGVVINPQGKIGNEFESRTDNNFYEVSFVARGTQSSADNAPQKDISLSSDSTKVLLTKSAQEVEFKGKESNAETWVLREKDNKNAVVNIGGRTVNLKQGRSEIKAVEDKYVSITPVYFGDEGVLVEVKIQEQASEWEDPVVYSIQEVQAFQEEAQSLRAVQADTTDSNQNSASDTKDSSKNGSRNVWGISLGIIVLLIVAFFVYLSSHKSPSEKVASS